MGVGEKEELHPGKAGLLGEGEQLRANSCLTPGSSAARSYLEDALEIGSCKEKRREATKQK